MKNTILGYIDILVLIETKVHDISLAQFSVNGFWEPYRLDSYRNRGGFMIYNREDKLRKLLEWYTFPCDIERVFAKRNFRKFKWLLSGTCHSPSKAHIYYFDNMDREKTLTIIMKKVYLKEILTRKYLNLLKNLSFTCLKHLI